MSPEEIELKEKDIIGKFPNTYTFTKNIGEKLLKKHRGNVPLVIVRPSIIGAAAYEPFVGWVDAVSAATAVYITGCLGMLRDLNGMMDYIGDQIPVDFCSNLIIASTADIMNKNDLIVYHAASSSRNPITWIQTIRYFWPYVARNRFEKRILDPYFDMYQIPFLFKSSFFLKRMLPAKAYSFTAKLIGNEQMKKDSERYLKALGQWQQIAHYFTHFTNNEWIYDTYNSFQLKARLLEEDLKEFYFDIGDLDWKLYFPNFGYGLQKFILKEEVELPHGDRTSIISTRPRLLGDFMWVYYHGKNEKTRDHEQIKKFLLNNPNVKATIRGLIDKEITSSTLGEPRLLQNQLTRSIEIIDRLAARLNYTKMRMLGYVMHKAYKNMYEKVIINKSGLEKVRELSNQNDGNIIFWPTHRSYMDFLIVSYILYGHDIKVPHIWAGDDFLNIALIHTFLRNSGAFFMKRSFKDDPLYKTIFTEYVQMLLGDSHSIEFFVEGTRARSGKMLNPKFGLLNVLTNSYFQNSVENLHFVPITINYSRVLEGETFPLELLGESKVKESLSRILNATRYIKMNFGTIYVEFAKPINFKSYVQEMWLKNNLNPVNKSDQKMITNQLGYDIVYALTNNLIIMPTSICAAILLMHRKGINEEDLVKQVGFLIKALDERKAPVTCYSNNPKIWVAKGTFHLNETVGKKKDVFEPRVIPKIDYKNILLLGYYRNNLMHHFINEALVACSIYEFGQNSTQKDGIDRKELYEKVTFISNILRNEFVIEKNMKEYDNFENVIDFMIRTKTLLAGENDKIFVHPDGENMINFLNSLIWPFIDTYWVSFVFIFSLVPSKFVQEGKIIEKIQWFAESLYEDQIISFYESCSQETIKNAVNTYYSDGIIVKKKLETITVKPFVQPP